MEMTNDIQFLLPIMVTIMVSKWVGDLLTHSFYHALLEVCTHLFKLVYTDRTRAERLSNSGQKIDTFATPLSTHV